MLFDIRGRRRRVIQVIYVFLALLLGGSLVFFGIGGDAPGGLGDALGISQNSSGTGNPQFDEDIEQAEATLETDPGNKQALLTLARTQYVAGNSALEVDEQGFATVTDEVRDRFEASVDAWERYLDEDPAEPDSSVANIVFQAYDRLASSTGLPDAADYLDGAQRTAAIIAEERPSANSYFQLAAYSYFNGEVQAGDEAAEKALAEAREEDTGQDALRSLEQQLKQVKRTGASIQEQIETTRPGKEELENPLQDLGGGGGVPLPGAGG